MFSSKLFVGAFLGLGLLAVSTTIHSVQAQTSVQQELSARNLTLQQARQLARQAGINPDDPEALRRFGKSQGVPDAQIEAWLQEMGLTSAGTPSGEVTDLRDTSVSSSDIIEEPAEVPSVVGTTTATPKEDGLPFYGYDIFKNVPDAFKPAAIGPVDDGYIVGPNDEMRLTLWGATEFQYELSVDAEGRIFIPSIGQITVAGQTLAELREYLKTRLSQSYSGLTRNPPTIFLDVTLTRLRPIRVFVIGEVVQPGGYTFSSYSTLFNVLYGVGGPTTKGSLRNIQLIRDGKIATTFDFYEFLLKGVDSGSIRLQNNDRIFIPPRINKVSIRGPVLRPAIYELKGNEGLKDLVDFSGGLEPEAYGKRFHVDRIIPINERTDPSIARTVLDFNLERVLNGSEQYRPQDGDEVRILNISDRVENVAYIDGAVYQPGSYEISEEVRTVRDLILAADSLTGDAFTGKGELVRTNEDLTKTFISLDVDGILADIPQQNIVLQRLDRIKIFSRTELENEYTVQLSGAVANPQDYDWVDSMRVYDLLFRGKGLFDPEQKEKIFLKRADLIRLNEDGRSTRVIPFNLEEALNNEGFGREFLEPFDQVIIYANSVELITDKFVEISGSVKNPGRYAFNENMTMEDLILKAGGFTEASYLGEAEISRLVKPEIDFSKSERIFIPLLPDTFPDDIFYEPMLWDTILKKAKAFNLQHRDKVFIRSNPRFELQKQVTINGEVQFPGEYVLISENEKLSDIFNRAGGLSPEGYVEGAKLFRNDRQVIIDISEAIRGGFKEDIELLPGDVIEVPRHPSTVSVNGNVWNEGLVKYSPGEKLSYYLDRVGGMKPESEKRVLLTQPDGATYSVKRKGLFKKNPVVLEGAMITVVAKPEEQDKEGLSPREFLQQTTATLTSALTVILLIDRAFGN